MGLHYPFKPELFEKDRLKGADLHAKGDVQLLV